MLDSQMTRGAMNDSVSSSPLTVSEAGSKASALAVHWPALAVLLLGFAILYAVGWSSIPAAHNAAHDARHANGFPCH